MAKLPAFELHDVRVDGIPVLVPHGEIDALTAPQIGRSIIGLLDQGERSVVVDLSEATFMDSTGLGVLVNGLRQLGRRNGRLAIVCPTERILRPFRIAGLQGLLPIFSSREEAIGELAPAV